MDILPSETIPSFMARTQVLAIYKKADSHYQSILGCDYTQTCGVSTHRLKKLSELLNTNLHQLIMEHTAYPYFAHFMTEEHAKSLYEAIISDKPTVLESETGSSSSRLGIPNYHSYCPLCAEEDIKAHGVAYWHQIHSLPGVSACLFHKCQLIRSRKQPKILATPDLRQIEVADASENEILFARLSANLCQEFNENPSPDQQIESYRRQLDSAGYITASGYVRQGKLLEDIGYFWADLLQLPDFKNVRTGAANGKEQNFIKDLLRSVTKRTHPVKHILLQGFLNNCTFKEETPQPKNNHIPCNKVSTGDEKGTIALLKSGISLSKTAAQSGVSYYTVRKLAKQHNINHRSRPKKTTPEQETAALVLLKTGLSMKKVGDQVGLAESTVDNLLISHPEIRAARRKLKKSHFAEKLSQLRKQALSIIKQNPKMTRKELTESFSDVFIWLKNNDKDWLYRQLPKPVSASQAQVLRYKNQHLLWKKKQQQAIEGLRGFAIKMMNTPPANQRISPSYILKSLKIRNPQAHVRKTMPVFWQQLTRFAETHEDFQLRKLFTLHRGEPALFQIYSARRLLKIASAYPPVSSNVLQQAKLIQNGDASYKRESTLNWLLLKQASKKSPHQIELLRIRPKYQSHTSPTLSQKKTLNTRNTPHLCEPKKNYYTSRYWVP